jgi:hypothetical protein
MEAISWVWVRVCAAQVLLLACQIPFADRHDDICRGALHIRLPTTCHQTKWRKPSLAAPYSELLAQPRGEGRTR